MKTLSEIAKIIGATIEQEMYQCHPPEIIEQSPEQCLLDMGWFDGSIEANLFFDFETREYTINACCRTDNMSEIESASEGQAERGTCPFRHIDYRMPKFKCWCDNYERSFDSKVTAEEIAEEILYFFSKLSLNDDNLSIDKSIISFR